MGPAVLFGRLRYVSVSQVERFDVASFGGCQRKWWFRYVGGLKETQGKAAKLGEQVHAQIEYYLKTGTDTLGELARAARRFIPKPGPGLLVEVAIGGPREHMPGGAHGPIDSALTLAGVPVIGRLDLVDERVAHVVEDPATGDALEVVEPGVLEINDWKSTRQIDDVVDETGYVLSRGYAKKAAEVGETHQMVSYGKWGVVTHPGLTGVRLSHTCIQTQGQRVASKRSVLLSVDEVLRRSRRGEAVVEDMKTIAGVPRVEDVPPNYKACNAYGGCQFRGQCPRDPRAVMAEVFAGVGGKRQRRVDVSKTEGIMSLLDRVNAKKAASGGAPVTPAKPAVDPAVEVEKKKMAAEEAALRAGVTPPDQPEPSDVAQLPDEDMVAGREGGCPVGGTQRELDSDAIATRMYACVCGESVKVKPVKLGDGKYYGMVKKHGEVAVEEKPAESAKLADAVVDAVQKGLGQIKFHATVTAGLTLMLDSADDGVPAKRLEAYAEHLAAQLSKEHAGEIDIRCAPGDSPLAFGKWKGALATLVRAQPPEPGVYAVSSASEFGMVAFDALASTAARVTRGLR